MAGDNMEVVLSAPLEALLARGPAIVTEELRRGLEVGTTLMQAEIIRRHDRGVTGVLRGGIQTEIRGQRADLQGRVFSTVRYAMPHEEGGRPHHPPFRAIEAWARRVGGRNVSDLARRVYWTIVRRGTKAQPKWRPAFQTKLAAVKARMDKVLVLIDQRLGSGR